MGWTIFPSMQNAADNFEQLFSDVATLLGYDPSRQMAVIEKIDSFIGRIALRAIVDMVCMQRKDELADMWYTGDIRPDQKCKVGRGKVILHMFYSCSSFASSRNLQIFCLIDFLFYTCSPSKLVCVLRMYFTCSS